MQLNIGTRIESKAKFSAYTELTTGLKLHPWQTWLCDRLELLVKESGSRLLIHGPPQFGKSILLSKRFPAWFLGNCPDARIVVAAYNQGHAESLTSVVRDTLRSPLHRWVFPTELVKPSSEGEFSTTIRHARGDSQPSVRAVGLLSGFTGTGADLLIIDDPYASPDDARSPAINERVWRWWKELASVRIHDNTHVVVMFHRYHQDDLAGRLLAERGWEHIRFPALADANEDGSDPTGRLVGEPLSSIRSKRWILDQKESNPITFAGQFQGRPLADEGAMFNREWFEIVPEAPSICQWYRGYDLATSVRDTADYSASARLGVDHDGVIYISDVWKGRLAWPEMRVQVISTSIGDGHDTYAGIEDKSIGLAMIQELLNPRVTPVMAGYSLVSVATKGDKRQRAQGWAARAKAGRIKLVRGAWNETFINECVRFSGLGDSHDDQVDAVSVAWAMAFQDEGNRKFDTPRYRSPYGFDSEEDDSAG